MRMAMRPGKLSRPGMGLDAVNRTVVEHQRNKLDGLQLDEQTTASTFINIFIICCQELEKLGEAYTNKTKKEKFLGQIKDNFYDITVQTLQEAINTKTFDELVAAIWKREQTLELDSAESSHHEGMASRIFQVR